MSDSGGSGGQSDKADKAAVEVMAPGARQVSEAGARPLEAGRQVLEDGGRERFDNDSSLSSNNSSGGSPTFGGAGEQSRLRWRSWCREGGRCQRLVPVPQRP